jgi:membrane fusion protein (multidrug efflux system)
MAAVPFIRTMRSLEADGFRPSLVLMLVGLLLGGAWLGWFLLWPVRVLEVTSSARIEVERAAHPIEAPVGGRVVAVHLVLDERVEAGHVLVELDAASLELELSEQRAKNDGLVAQVNAVRDEIGAVERALAEQRGAARARVDEARARQDEAEAAARFGESETKRSAGLRTEGLLSEADARKLAAEAEQRRAGARALDIAIPRIEAEQRSTDSESGAKLARLRRDLAVLEADKATGAAIVVQLEHEIDRRKIRAPVSGRLGEIANLQVGGVVREGDTIGAVVPAGDFRIVAEFPSSAAIGRVRAGQAARMQPAEFPWTQYGSVAAVVRRVASEGKEGQVRVELDVDSRQDSDIPLQHGLPGTLQVEVERVSPAALVLRAAGRRFARPARR